MRESEETGVNNDKEYRKKRRVRVEDLPSRLISTAGDNFIENCIENVFDRITFDCNPIECPRRPTIPHQDITKSLPSILSNNLRHMGMNNLLPAQRYTLPLMTNCDVDLFLEAATGNGKTLSFLIPIAVKLLDHRTKVDSNSKKGRPFALIISNTQQLQIQTYLVAKNLLEGTDLRAVVCIGQTSLQELRNQLDKGVDILVATTGRLLQTLKEERVFLDSLEYFIYDEADKMTAFGAFKQEVLQIREYIPDHVKIKLRNAFFTATLEGAEDQFDDLCRKDKRVTVRIPGNPLISHTIIPLSYEMNTMRTKLRILLGLLNKDLVDQGRERFDKSVQLYKEKTVIFVKERTTCNFLADYLTSYGFSVGVLNSDKSLEMRSSTLTDFDRGLLQAVVATDSFARGHDVSNIKHVINFELDGHFSTFKHRAGRTARIGHKGRCTTFLPMREYLLEPECPVSHRFSMQLAGYLLLECGQRLPQCLQRSAIAFLKEIFQIPEGIEHWIEEWEKEKAEAEYGEEEEEEEEEECDDDIDSDDSCGGVPCYDDGTDEHEDSDEDMPRVEQHKMNWPDSEIDENINRNIDQVNEEYMVMDFRSLSVQDLNKEKEEEGEEDEEEEEGDDRLNDKTLENIDSDDDIE